MQSVPGVRVRFGAHEVQLHERQLRTDGKPVVIGARAFDVLVALIEGDGRTVSRADLLDAAWPGLVVEENNLSVQIANLRRLLGPETITTIPGLGYRFSAPLQANAADASMTAASAPVPAPTKNARAGNVAPFQHELIGRDADVAQVETLLEQHRLVTVSGAGGIGKTRLALAVAARLRDRFAAGTWVVELAPVAPAAASADDAEQIGADARQVAAAIALGLGRSLPGLRDMLDELAEALAEEDLLLVLDNCEHLVAGAGHVAQLLVARTRQVRLLTTTQAPLKLSSEHVFPLAPLSVPRDDDTAIEAHGAIRLLVERVRALNPRFALGPANAADAVDICRRLDGLPLAIELAAARVPLLGLAGVRERLDDRLQLLTSGPRGAAARHRTLRAMLAWSHSLLTPAEAAAFRRAATFAGSFDLDQVRAVLVGDQGDAWEALDILDSLVYKSLIMVEPGVAEQGEADERPRYRLLESARAYAAEMLRDAGEREESRRRHAQAYAQLFATSMAQEWKLASQVRRDRYLPDLDNARAALEWAEHADVELYATLAGSIAWLFAAAGHSVEGLAHCRRALERLPDDGNAGLRARLFQETCQHDRSRSGLSKLAWAKQAVRLLRPLGDAAALYSALGRLAIAAALCGRTNRGDAATAEMGRLRDATWPPLSEWDWLNARDYVANAARRQNEAEKLAREELALARAHNDSGKMVFAMMAMEQCVAARGDYAEAVDRGRELLEVAMREKHVADHHVYLFNLATALAMCDRLDDALPLARRSAELDERHGSLWQGLDLMALIAWRRQRIEAAARIIGRSDAVNAHRGGDREPVEANVYDRVVEGVKAILPAERWQALREEGAALSDKAATALALEDEPT